MLLMRLNNEKIPVTLFSICLQNWESGHHRGMWNPFETPWPYKNQALLLNNKQIDKAITLGET